MSRDGVSAESTRVLTYLCSVIGKLPGGQPGTCLRTSYEALTGTRPVRQVMRHFHEAYAPLSTDAMSVPRRKHSTTEPSVSRGDLVLWKRGTGGGYAAFASRALCDASPTIAPHSRVWRTHFLFCAEADLTAVDAVG